MPSVNHEPRIVFLAAKRSSTWKPCVGTCKCGWDTPIATESEIKVMLRDHMIESGKSR